MKINITLDVDWYARTWIAAGFCNRTGQDENSSYTDAEKKPASRGEIKAYLDKVMPYVLKNPEWLLREIERNKAAQLRDGKSPFV